MTDQFTPGSRSRGTTGGMPVGEPHDQADAGHAVSEMKDMGTELIGAVRDGAGSMFEEQRNRAADEIAALGDMLRRSIDPSRRGTVTRYIEDAAREITGFAETLRTRSFDMLAGDIEDFARRWPIAFMASAIGVGFVAGRFLISSSSRPATQTPAMAATTQPMPTPATTGMGNQPVGGARHDYGAVSGGVSGGTNSGYGAGGMREGR